MSTDRSSFSPDNNAAAESALVDLMVDCHYDPLKFVIMAYPWLERGGPLEMYPGPDEWQAAFLQEWGEEMKKRRFDGVHAVAPIRMTRASGHGAGKLACKSLIINSLAGSPKWGDLYPGDYLWGRDGMPTKIVARHEQGVTPIYKVTFDDRSSTLCGLEHLWTVRGRKERRRELVTWRTLTTGDILDAGVKRSNGVSEARQWEIPSHDPVEYPEAPINVHPYFMGIWLGDGTRGKPEYTKPYPEIVTRLCSLGMAVTEYSDGKHRRVSVPRLTDPVFQRHCHNKYIPDCYKFNSVHNRMELLRGLADSDGEVCKHGTVGYSTTSLQLAEDVVWLVRSLGGKAMIQPAVKHPFYYAEGGARVDCRDCYRVTINIDWNPFCLQHRAERFKAESEHRYSTRWIDSIEYSHDEDSMCVTVDDPNGLYLANDFIVTHNSIMTAFITDFIMSTRPNCRGTVTANTYGQLETKTWAAVQKWTKMCLTADWFTVTGNLMYRNDARENWFTAAISCAEENSQAFAGQHAADSTSFYIFDEGSNIPDAIYNVADGGLTDGESMSFIFGNPTRATGKLFEVNFGTERKRWNHQSIDARTCKYTNKELLAEWEEDWGVDSDRFRVQVRGLPPNASDLQFISSALIAAAQTREVTVLRNDPLVCGLDVSRGGADYSVFRFRRGLDARSIPAIRISGENAKDSTVIIAKALDILKNGVPMTVDKVGQFGPTSEVVHLHIVQLFIDATGVGGPLYDQLKALGYGDRVTEIQFGWEAPNTQGYQQCANMRSWMWENMRVWLAKGAIDASTDLESDLSGPMYHYNPTKNQLVLESKESMKKRRGTLTHSGSPDDGDALALTFARPVAPKIGKQHDDDQDDMQPGIVYSGGGRGRVWG